MKKKLKRIFNNLYPFIVSKKTKKKINDIWDKTSDEDKKLIYDIYVKYNKKSKDLKSVLRLLKDIRYMKNKYGFKYEEYFMYGFRYKILYLRKTFIAGGDMKEYIAFLNPPMEKKVLRDKYFCYMNYKDYYKRDIIKLESEDDYKSFSSFISKHKSFVVKPYNKAFGTGVRLINSVNYKDKKVLFNELLGDGSVVLEEVIVQDERMKVLHPGSVNTIRMIPFIKEDGEVIIHFPFIKIGVNNSFVDNGGAGGILALIDEKTGKIITDGIDEVCNKYKYHPNSNIKLKGFQIPLWDEAVKLAKSLAPLNNKLKYIGWDFALSKDGWIIVEGNGATQFIAQQMADGKGKKKEFESLIGYKIKKK